MTYTDAVQVIREAITAATGIPTARILQHGFTDGPLPIAHVSLINADPGEYDRAERALAVRPVVGVSGWVDEAEVESTLGVQPYFEAVEVVHMTATVTHRPISDDTN